MAKVVNFSYLAVKILEQTYPGLLCKGMKSEIRKYARPRVIAKIPNAFAGEEDASEEEKAAYVEDEVRGLLRDATFNPDAFVLDPEAEELILFEVEDTNPLTVEKLELIIRTRWALSEVDLDVKLFVVDRYALRVDEINLGRYEEILFPNVQRVLPVRPQ